jgi:hypothetical protein
MIIEEGFTIEFYKETIEKNYEEIHSLKEVIRRLRSIEIKLRDKIAARIYTQIYTATPTAEKAVEDAYIAADIFLKVRDANSEPSLIEDIQFFIKNVEDNTKLGEKIREQFGKKEIKDEKSI